MLGDYVDWLLMSADLESHLGQNRWLVWSTDAQVQSGRFRYMVIPGDHSRKRTTSMLKFYKASFSMPCSCEIWAMVCVGCHVKPAGSLFPSGFTHTAPASPAPTAPRMSDIKLSPTCHACIMPIVMVNDNSPRAQEAARQKQAHKS